MMTQIMRGSVGLLLVTLWAHGAYGADKPQEILFYDPAKAVAYAEKWCNGGNDCTSGTKGQFHTDNSTDCTHFMSHVLAAGGVRVLGKDAKCDKDLCIRAIEMGEWFEKAAKTYVNVKRIDRWQDTKAGDFAFATDFIFRPWQLRVGENYRHAMLLVEPAQEDHAVVYSHTSNLCGKPTAHFKPEQGIFFRIEPSPLDGTWRSTDADKRFELKIAGKTVAWKEFRKAGEGSTFTHTAEFAEAAAGAYRLSRPNDEATLTAVGFSDARLRGAIGSKSPQPSTLTVRWEKDHAVGEWHGLLVKKKRDGTLDAIVQPDQVPGKTFEFKRE